MIASNPFIYIMNDPEVHQACSYLSTGKKTAEKIGENKTE